MGQSSLYLKVAQLRVGVMALWVTPILMKAKAMEPSQVPGGLAPLLPKEATGFEGKKTVKEPQGTRAAKKGWEIRCRKRKNGTPIWAICEDIIEGNIKRLWPIEAFFWFGEVQLETHNLRREHIAQSELTRRWPTSQHGLMC